MSASNPDYLNMRFIILSLAIGLAWTHSLLGQSTGILLNTPEAMEGYTLFSVAVDWPNDKVVLIDNCGNVINEWTPGEVTYHSKLLPNGNLLYEQDDKIFEMDWDGEIVSTTQPQVTEPLFLNYEVLPLDNERYLCVGRRALDSLGFEAIGYNQEFSFVIPTVIDVVVEIQRGTGEVLWEWNIGDHVIQERDSLLPNYGSIAENPQLLNMDAVSILDMTYGESFMINGMDYNPKLDQIALSVRKISEVIIIDHSTTPEEAASSVGGNSGKGGDILYRWGNPQNYGQGTQEDQQLWYQHNPNWVTEGPYVDHLMMYDNGLVRPNTPNFEPYSAVPIIDPPMDVEGNYLLEANSSFGPSQPVRRYSKVDGDLSFYSNFTSGAKWLPNGNVFVTEGDNGNLMELNPEGKLVWRYRVPTIDQTFRAEKYPVDYPAFEGKDLTPKGPLDMANSTYNCLLTTDTDESVFSSLEVEAFFRADQQAIIVTHEEAQGLPYRLMAVSGKQLQHGTCPMGTSKIGVGQYPVGIYFLSFWSTTGKGIYTQKIFLQE